MTHGSRGRAGNNVSFPVFGACWCGMRACAYRWRNPLSHATEFRASVTPRPPPRTPACRHLVSLRVHRARNTLAKVSVHDQAEVKADLLGGLRCRRGRTRRCGVTAAQRQAAAFAATWQARYPAAVACVTDDLASLTVHLRFPAEHWHRYNAPSYLTGMGGSP